MTTHRFSTARLEAIGASSLIDEFSPAQTNQLMHLLTPKTLHFLPDDWQQCPQTPAQLTDWLADKLARCELLLVQDKQAQFIGLVMLHFSANTVQLGYLIGEVHWGQGYASELLQGLVAHLQAAQSNVILNAGVAEDNPASIKVLEKAGFVPCQPHSDEAGTQRYYTLSNE
ncbi:GNAT family N-acetyltransferase [Pseudoalteromonas sp. DL2-H2.2]|uniref:GNAT family N-acetyltransferase n=1 Tax=Pseudoalteromonas sp. DL2-H2.2 TaxID=2908889 RepID=UPI001F24D1B6|nr:GNAT family N-acetyltransferase [Pseudoalteromonas sp. DL2-H2.2]MCF2910033.1 GNAT family N-acetyltransferase [Pseudoalteromonas sp. DL2-H2.2]